jgi:hypothetical protein
VLGFLPELAIGELELVEGRAGTVWFASELCAVEAGSLVIDSRGFVQRVVVDFVTEFSWQAE